MTRQAGSNDGSFRELMNRRFAGLQLLLALFPQSEITDGRQRHRATCIVR